MFILHHLNSSRSQRLVWMFELLKLDYEITVYQRDATTNLAPSSLKAIHPLGTAPIISHNGNNIVETGAICEYIVKEAKDTTLIPPKEHDDFVNVQFWSHFAEGSFMPPLVTSMVLNKGIEKASPFFIKFVVKKFVEAVINAYFGKAVARNMSFVEDHLEGKQWLVGNNITVADIQMSFGLEAMYNAGKLADSPNMTAYVERFQSEPSYKLAMKKMAAAEKAAS
ncbi:glutathione S-transferase [Glaciecola punicea ACAM 611]|uniref:Glutathione S-transferase n=1 Tax=Glaciecola punicea ACAM 611 TaxID=1121923 RepID=H5T7H1_9ALTE|nr:glutathione S-transferase [Glaciecola punicea]OFA32878.1 glutathione S-transferase [Glaciecola punicea]GAB54248.1 glutathione S-transferase [Glaciecola punicea ACAM 611]